MNTISPILMITLVVSCVHGANVHDQSDSWKKHFVDCANKAGITFNDVKALDDKPSDWPLSDKEQYFLHCCANPLVSDGKVNVQRIQNMMTNKYPTSEIDVTSAINKCGSTGIDPNNLVSSYHTSTFFRCLFAEIREQTSADDSDFIQCF